jgi:hypothetical protein
MGQRATVLGASGTSSRRSGNRPSNGGAA